MFTTLNLYATVILHDAAFSISYCYPKVIFTDIMHVLNNLIFFSADADILIKAYVYFSDVLFIGCSVQVTLCTTL